MSELPRSFVSARQLAVDMARSQVAKLEVEASMDPLDAFHVEAEGCWVFFLRDDLVPSGESGQMVFTAYAVAKHVEMSALVYDFRPDLAKMRAYVEAWSLQALGRTLEARAAMAAFRA